MTTSITRLLTISSALALSLATAAFAQERKVPEETTPGSRAKAGDAMEVKALIAVISPIEGNDVKGTVTFETVSPGKVQVTARVTGLQPNSKHGFHIHEFGDISADDGTSAGGHFNPDDHPHGLPDKEERHAGDLGNLEANGEGVAEMTLEVSNLSLAGEHAILGRAVIVHAKPDTGAQPTGDAGARIGYGVIGIKSMK